MMKQRNHRILSTLMACLLLLALLPAPAYAGRSEEPPCCLRCETCIEENCLGGEACKCELCPGIKPAAPPPAAGPAKPAAPVKPEPPKEEPSAENNDTETKKKTDEKPTDPPADKPADKPTDGPSDKPGDDPTDKPTDTPSDAPTDDPSDEPTGEPTDDPTDDPTDEPTDAPTDVPTDAPTGTLESEDGTVGLFAAPAAAPLMLDLPAVKTVSLTSDYTSVLGGDTVTFTATVVDQYGAPMENISVALSSGEPESSTSAQGVATIASTIAGTASEVKSITATANGVTSNPVSITILADTITPTKMTVAAVPSAVAAGGSVTITPTIVPPAVTTGTLSITGEGVSGATFPVGTAYTLTAPAVPGTYTYTVSYPGEADAYGPSTGTVTITVTKLKPTIGYSGASTGAIGQPANITVTLSGGYDPMGGTVTLSDGSTTLGPINLAGNAATFTYTPQSAGSKTLTATYSGDDHNEAATGAGYTFTVSASTSTTTLSAPSSALVNKPITLTGTVAGSNPTGTVTFKQNGTAIGSPVTIANGTASTTYTPTATGTLSFTAEYAGDTNNTASTSTAVTTTVVNQLTPGFTLYLSRNDDNNYSVIAQLTAPAGGPAPTGYVTFRILGGGGKLREETVAITGNSAVTTLFNPWYGHDLRVQATYYGDTNYVTATTETTVRVTRKETVIYAGGQMVGSTGNAELYARVRGAIYNGGDIQLGNAWRYGPWGYYYDYDYDSTIPTGYISFYANGKLLQQVRLDSRGEASISWSKVPRGTHTIEVAYEGDSYHPSARTEFKLENGKAASKGSSSGKSSTKIDNNKTPLAAPEGYKNIRLLGDGKDTLEAYDTTMLRNGDVITIQTSRETNAYTFEISMALLDELRASGTGSIQIQAGSNVTAELPFGFTNGFERLSTFLSGKGLDAKTLWLRLTIEQIGEDWLPVLSIYDNNGNPIGYEPETLGVPMLLNGEEIYEISAGIG